MPRKKETYYSSKPKMCFAVAWKKTPRIIVRFKRFLQSCEEWRDRSKGAKIQNTMHVHRMKQDVKEWV